MPTQDFPSELFIPFLQEEDGIPRHLALFRAFQQAILQGNLATGSKLPASRPLCAHLGVSRNTVKTAYEMLQAEGYIETRHGSGSFVSASLPEQHLQGTTSPTNTLPPIQQTPGLSNLAQRLQNLNRFSPVESDSLLSIARTEMVDYPWAKWQSCVNIANRKLKHLERHQMLGCKELRIQIAHYLRVTRGVQCTADQILICSGSQQAMYLAIQLLVNPRDTVLVEDPGYSGINGALALADAQKIPVPADQDGFLLEHGLALAPDTRVILLTPSRNFPMGYTLSLERRLALINWARQTGSWLIEDDYDSEFRFDDSPLTALQGLGGTDCVIYAGTFSRIMHHTLRLGYLVLPESLVEPFARARSYLDGGLSLLPQMAMAEFMASGAFTSHVRRMRKRYLYKRGLLKTLIAEQLGGILQPTNGDGSMHSVFLLPASISDREICQLANKQGLGIRALSQFYSGTPEHQGLVIGFAGYSEKEMRSGVQSLTAVYNKLHSH